MKKLSVGILLCIVSGCTTQPLPKGAKPLAVTFDKLLTYSNTCTVVCDFIAPCTGVIQYKDNLSDTNWFTLWTGVITNSHQVSVSFTNVNVPHRFYRAFTTYP